MVNGEDDAPVRALTDCGTRAARGELRRREALVRAVDRRAVAHEQRATSDRVGDHRPVGLEDERSVSVVPGAASACSFVAALPRATSTAVPGWIRTEVPDAALRTGTTRSVFGVADGKAPSTAVNAPAMRGVDEPQSGT